MLTSQQIAQLKKDYTEIFSAVIEDEEITFRALTIGEYNELKDIASAIDQEEFAILNAVLDPSPIDLDNYMPGSVSTLYENILELSGFTSLEVCAYKLDLARDKVETALELMKIFILAAMPNIDYFGLNDCSFQELADMVARAEKILDIKGGLARGAEYKMMLQTTEPSEEQPSGAKRTNPFTMEDIERENRKMANSPNPDTAGLWDKGPKRVEEGATKLGTASADDPVARQLWQALQG